MIDGDVPRRMHEAGQQWFSKGEQHSLGTETLHWVVEEENRTYRRSGMLHGCQSTRQTQSGKGRKRRSMVSLIKLKIHRKGEPQLLVENVNTHNVPPPTHPHTHTHFILHTCQHLPQHSRGKIGAHYSPRPTSEIHTNCTRNHCSFLSICVSMCWSNLQRQQRCVVQVLIWSTAASSDNKPHVCVLKDHGVTSGQTRSSTVQLHTFATSPGSKL